MTNEKNLKRIKAAFKRWEHIVARWGWDYKVIYRDSTDEMPTGSMFNNMAVTTHDYSYLTATTFVNLKCCFDESDEDIELMVLHELVHLLIAPIKDECEEHREHVCVMVSRVLQDENNRCR